MPANHGRQETAPCLMDNLPESPPRPQVSYKPTYGIIKKERNRRRRGDLTDVVENTTPRCPQSCARATFLPRIQRRLLPPASPKQGRAFAPIPDQDAVPERKMSDGQGSWQDEKRSPCKARRMRPVELFRINHQDADVVDHRPAGAMRVYTETDAKSVLGCGDSA